MMVFIVLDDSFYPPKILSLFEKREDAERFALSSRDSVVEEWELIK